MSRSLSTLIAVVVLLAGPAAVRPVSSVDLLDIQEAEPPRVTEEGVLFTYKPEKRLPRYVMVSGDFDGWRSPHLMTRNEHDVFLFLYSSTDERGRIIDAGKYRYRLLVDGIWLDDPANDQATHDRHGEKLSVFEVKQPVYQVERNPHQVGEDTYVFYYRGEAEQYVRLVGDFNNWNPYTLPMEKNQAGIWEIEVTIPPGRHAYRFYVDGKYRNDPLATTTMYDRFDNPYA
ncbi:MAG: glycogen-binding domain-containing protein, partial [Spirochaetota bacterium]